MASAQPRAWALASARERRWQSGLSLALAAASGLLALFGTGLTAGFAMLAALLIAIALALPPVLSGLLTLLERTAHTPISEWFWADTRQQVPGLSLALMALLLALSANIGVGTMVDSFRATFTGWLDQRLASELYVTLEDEADGPAFRDFIEPRVEAALPIWNVERNVLDQPVEIFGVIDHPTYRDSFEMLRAAPSPWTAIHTRPATVISEQLARRKRLDIGDMIPLPGNGPDVEVVGIYGDYGNPKGQIVIALDRLEQLYRDVDKTSYGLRLPANEVAALRSSLTEEFGLPEDNMIDQAALKAFSLEVFERTFAVTGALNVLTLGIAGLAILTSLLTLASMRLPQLAPVWALGLTRASLARLELLRSVILAGMTFLIAVPAGLLLAFVLLAVINVAAFGWRLPMHVFPVDWLVLLILSLMAAGLAALWPAIRLARTPPADLIRVFVHDC